MTTEPGSLFHIKKLNLQSSELLNGLLERMNLECGKSQSQPQEVENEILFDAVPEESLIEAFSSREFQTNLPELETSVANSSVSECAQRFTALLQLTLKSISTLKRKKKKSQRNTFPRN